MIDSFSYEKFETFFSNFSFVMLFFSMITFWLEASGILTNGIISQNNFKNSARLPLASNITSNTIIPGFSDNTSPSITENNPNQPLSNALKSAVPPVIFKSSLDKTSICHNDFGFAEKNHSLFQTFSLGFFGIVTANASLLALLILRWIDSGHFPLSNLYESLMFLSWSLTFFHLILDKITSKTLTWLGAITSPTALFTNAFANFSLPVEMQHASALVPALQSNWLMMHVTVMILSYAALIFGSLLSIGFLILTFSISSDQYETELKTLTVDPKFVNRSMSKIQWAYNLDNLSYRMLGIAFPLLTIGILSGAVWANEAWGSYWSWDPKETWALLTWFVFAIYLHTRITKNWQGKKPALIASFGFFVVWICYLGVNLLGEGLHSYGWIQF